MPSASRWRTISAINIRSSTNPAIHRLKVSFVQSKLWPMHPATEIWLSAPRAATLRDSRELRLECPNNRVIGSPGHRVNGRKTPLPRRGRHLKLFPFDYAYSTAYLQPGPIAD